MRLKIKKKEKKKDQNKNNKSKKKKENKNKRLSPSWDSNHDRLRGKQGSYPLDYCIVWLLNRSVKYLCKFLYIVWETRSLNILRFLANSFFLNQQKGRGSLSVRKMNLDRKSLQKYTSHSFDPFSNMQT